MENKHIIQLDGLRFVAIFMVMIAHWLQWQWGNSILTQLPFNHGVTLFFVLSGFLITQILLQQQLSYQTQNKKLSVLIKHFYIRRLIRIFPVYYFTLFFLWIINYDNTREIFPWLVSYTTNLYQSIHQVNLGDFNHFWSLAVEEQFYLFWPLLLLFITRKNQLWVILCTIFIALGFKTYLYLNTENWMAISYHTISCMHALGIGGLLAYMSMHHSSKLNALNKNKWIGISLLLYLLILATELIFKLSFFKNVVNEFGFALVSAIFILRASQNSFTSLAKVFLENKWIVYLGKISYGLYIFHLFIPNLVRYLYPNVIELNHQYALTKYVLFVVYFILAFILAHFSWKFIEAPINRLKANYSYE